VTNLRTREEGQGQARLGTVTRSAGTVARRATFKGIADPKIK